MLIIEQMQLKAALDEKFCRRLALELSSNFDLLLYGIRKEFLSKLGLSPEKDEDFFSDKVVPKGSVLSGGDLIYIEPDTLIYYKIPDFLDYIEIGIIGNGHCREFDSFKELIEKLVREHYPKTGAWEPVKKLAHSFNLMMENSRTIIPKDPEIAASRELENEKIRTLLQAIAEKDPIFLADLKNLARIENIDEVIKNLQDINLISSDFSLLCTRTGQQILKVSDKSALEDLAKKGFKCFVCGASIADEKVERTISCTAFGREILKDDYWFLVMTLNALKNLGIDNKDVFISNEDQKGSALFLNINSEAIMLYLTNKRLNLDDAYLINAQIAAYRLRHLILISALPVSILMQKHLQEANPGCGISFIQGMDRLSQEIRQIILEKEEERVFDILEDMNDLTPVPVEDMIMKRIIPGGDEKPPTGLENSDSDTPSPGKGKTKAKPEKTGEKTSDSGKSDTEENNPDAMEPEDEEVLSQLNDGIEALRKIEGTASTKKIQIRKK